ncbi:hypothetical protein Tco_1403631 [Tanacetum coccineum]
MLPVRTSSRVNEARGAKDTLGILFWGVMHKRFRVITFADFCYALKSLLSNVEQFKPLRFKCLVDVEVFRKILNIYPRVQRVDFAEVPDDETTLTFLIDLGYKGPLYKHPYMLRKSRINILWGMFYWENVDYPELIWEDFAFKIDNRQLKKGKRENMPYPRFTKIIINHFLSKHKSLTKLPYLHTHTIKDDGVVRRLKFVRIGEDF